MDGRPLKTVHDFESPEAYQRALHAPGNVIETDLTGRHKYLVGAGGEWRRMDNVILNGDMVSYRPRLTRSEKKAAKRARIAQRLASMRKSR